MPLLCYDFNRQTKIKLEEGNKIDAVCLASWTDGK